MKKNKGFTLVELLAVIAILALLITIAVPSVIALSNRIKGNMFCTKVENIETAAKMYANDNLDVFNNGNATIHVKDLINNNLFKREEKDCDCNNVNKPCVTDPRNKSRMDGASIILTRTDKQITAKYQYDPKGEKVKADEEYCKNK